MALNFGEVGTDCADEAQRMAIRSKVLTKAAEVMERRTARLSVWGARNPGAKFQPPKLIEDFHWPKMVGGVFYPKDESIRLNMKLLCDGESYEQTVAHEMAHSVAHQMLKAIHGQATLVPRRDPYAQSHGSGWQSIMRDMGYQPSRKMVADISAAFPEKYAGMTCACGMKLNITRRKLARDKASWTPGSYYLCKCGRHLEPAMFKGADRECKYGRTKRGTCRRRRR